MLHDRMLLKVTKSSFDDNLDDSKAYRQNITVVGAIAQIFADDGSLTLALGGQSLDLALVNRQRHSLAKLKFE
jgi:hypothetical protein